MNTHRKVAFVLTPTAILIAVTGILIYRYYTTPWSVIGVNLDELAGIRRFVPRPVAWAERAVTHEGEDIWAAATIPATGGNMDSLNKYVHRSKVPIVLRVFQGRTELRDTLFKPPPTDLPLTYAGFLHGSLKPGDSTWWRITEYVSLPPGEYWGMADAGKFSKKFKLRVHSIPDSLAWVLDMRDRLTGKRSWQIPGAGYQTMATRSDSNKDSLCMYAGMLTALPAATPLRMEGLRFCANYIGLHSRSDTAIWREVISEYLKEPRLDPEDAVNALWWYCVVGLDADSATYVDMVQKAGYEQLMRDRWSRPGFFKVFRHE